jgi:hypothetical protein
MQHPPGRCRMGLVGDPERLRDISHFDDDGADRALGAALACRFGLDRVLIERERRPLQKMLRTRCRECAHFSARLILLRGSHTAQRSHKVPTTVRLPVGCPRRRRTGGVLLA